MEGYLLACTKGRDAQLWFCQLEQGVLRGFTKAKNGQAVAVIQLTRHHIRVEAGVEGSCPNLFALYVMESAFCERTGRLLVASDREITYTFAAPTGDAMKWWCRAIQNWKRRAFNDPANASTAKSSDAYRREVESLMSVVTAFDLRLKNAKPLGEAKETVTSTIFRLSLTPTKPPRKDEKKRQSLHGGQPSQPPAVSSWIPSLRVPTWCRVRSNSPDH